MKTFDNGQNNQYNIYKTMVSWLISHNNNILDGNDIKERDFYIRWMNQVTKHSPNGVPPNGVPPNSVPPNCVPPNSVPPNSVPPNCVPPNSVPPNCVPPNSVPPNSVQISNKIKKGVKEKSHVSKHFLNAEYQGRYKKLNSEPLNYEKYKQNLDTPAFTLPIMPFLLHEIDNNCLGNNSLIYTNNM